MSMPIEIDGLSKVYRGKKNVRVEALRELGTAVNEGEFQSDWRNRALGVATRASLRQGDDASLQRIYRTLHVTAEESGEQLAPVRLLSPQDGAIAPMGQLGFVWEPVPRAAIYEVSFIAEADGRQVFSALTKEPRYTVPKGALGYFNAGYNYRWRVRAMNGDGKLLAKSAEWRLTLGRERR